MPAARERPQAAGRGIPALDPVPPIALVLAGVTSIQFGAALAATLFDDAGPAGVSVLRLGFAALVLLAVWRPWRRRHDPRALRLVAIFGLTLGAMNLTFYEALDRIPLGVAVTIEFLGPITVATLLSRRRLDLVWIALATLGIVLLAAPWQEGGGLDSVGVAFALVAAGFWGLYIVLAQRAGRFFDGGEGLAIAMVWAALIPLVPGIAQGGTDLLDPALLAAGFGVALLSSVIPYCWRPRRCAECPRASSACSCRSSPRSRRSRVSSCSPSRWAHASCSRSGSSSRRASALRAPRPGR